jgi:hypothetical protein
MATSSRGVTKPALEFDRPFGTTYNRPLIIIQAFPARSKRKVRQEFPSSDTKHRQT